MTENRLNEQESIQIIERMLMQTNRRTSENKGDHFILWGYITFFTSFLIWILLKYTHNPNCQWLWFLIPIFGFLGMTFIQHKKKNNQLAKTYFDSVIDKIWIVLGLASWVFMLLAFAGKMNMILGMITILMSIGTMMTALIIKHKILTISGLIGIFASILLFLFHNKLWTIPIFGLIFLITMVIPGHLMNNIKKQSRA